MRCYEVHCYCKICLQNRAINGTNIFIIVCKTKMTLDITSVYAIVCTPESPMAIKNKAAIYFYIWFTLWIKGCLIHHHTSNPHEAARSITLPLRATLAIQTTRRISNDINISTRLASQIKRHTCFLHCIFTVI